MSEYCLQVETAVICLHLSKKHGLRVKINKKHIFKIGYELLYSDSENHFSTELNFLGSDIDNYA